MVQNIIKWTIAISLLAGVIITIFGFIGNLAKNFLLEKLKKLSPKFNFIFGLIYLIGFFLIILISIILLMKILISPTDFHNFFDMLK